MRLKVVKTPTRLGTKAKALLFHHTCQPPRYFRRQRAASNFQTLPLLVAPGPDSELLASYRATKPPLKTISIPWDNIGSCMNLLHRYKPILTPYSRSQGEHRCSANIPRGKRETRRIFLGVENGLREASREGLAYGCEAFRYLVRHISSESEHEMC